jgi:uncharacterized protein YfbU (UPF0304 family)
MGQISITLPDELESKIRLASEQSGSSLSDYVRDLLKVGVNGISNPSYWEKLSLILAMENQQMLGKLTNNPKVNNWSYAIEALENGYVSEYRQIHQGIDLVAFPPEKAAFVHRVFDCYDDLQYSAKELEDKELAQKTAFPGYDGNNEGQYLGYAQFLVENSRWKHIKTMTSDLNSHHISSIYEYNLMLEKWDEIRSTKPRDKNLSKSEIEGILDARRQH